jgi:hypothetical protein
MRHLGLLAFSLLALTTPASAQVNLRWHFKKGQTFYVEEKLHVKQTIKMPDTVQSQEMEQTRVSRFKVLQIMPDGGAVLEQKIESVKAATQGVGGKEAASVLRHFQGAVFHITLDSKQHITKFEGFKALADKIARDNPDAAKLLRELVSKDNLQRPVAVLFSFAPEKPVSKGDHWQVKSPKVPFANFARLDMTDTYIFQGPEEGEKDIVRAGITTAITSSAPKAVGGLPFKVVRGEVKVKESQGHLLFNVGSGHLVRRKMKQALYGVFTLAFGNQQLNMEIEQQQTKTARVLDSNPLKK